MSGLQMMRVEHITMRGLKDFQKATVERIDQLFCLGQNRVLVADEVGMGKTLIARGVLVKTARLYLKNKDGLFKVVYICSNTSIANQNIQKLKISDSARIEGVSDTRLSMQHLKVTEQELEETVQGGGIQLIPLTPDTSFRLTIGGGTVRERALMYAILRRMDEFKHRQKTLERFLVHTAEKAWYSWAKKQYEDRVRDCKRKTGGRYPEKLIEKIKEYNAKKHVLDLLSEHLTERNKKTHPYSDRYVLNKLRIMFAQISTEMLQPDLVIMDEFQRFKFLLDSNQESDTGILAHRFLGNTDTRILLLSATPYKLYSTLEEIDAARVDEHYSEFLQVMDFLFEHKNQNFHQIWTNYSVALHELKDGDTTIIQVKTAAENAMYEGVCRTERISVMESGDYIDDASVDTALVISENDIKSYLAMGKLLKDIHADFSLNLDYVKSCPYLMSFMKNYREKQQIENYFQARKEEIEKAKNSLLWLNMNLINKYQELPKTNARLEKLKDVAFENHAELLLWIPPSRPYYELQGAYRNSSHFSKILVFSSWQMVPRMIGALLSYEAERKTIGRLYKQTKNVERKNTKYNAKRRYPYHRLQFTLSGIEPQRMSLFCLLYPSKELADMYDPIQCMNEGLNISEIERDIKRKLRRKLQILKIYQSTVSGQEDAKWYYLAPMLMDGNDYVIDWIEALRESMNVEYEEDENSISEKGNKAFYAHIEKLLDYIKMGSGLKLGKMPADLIDTLTDIVLGSPAVCIYRANGRNVAYASSLAKVFVNYFNSTESTAIVELSADQFHRKRADENSHWQDVLTYCKDGCFQAMFEEYLHLITESMGFTEEEEKAERILKIMINDLRIHTASYDVDTYDTFKARINRQSEPNRMRAHYAVAFINSESDNAKTTMRKDSIRGAFNSPLKPFILATTSIGQEGLDFHHYCRKIMHWNLPSNPIDLEQREGRINRYKCLAIRQNVADKYGKIHFQKDLWNEMFQAAQAERQDGQSELVPFWCFGKNQKIKIERIVPMYPMSKDEINYERLIKILSLYRLTLGQARQEELLEYLFKEWKEPEGLKKLFFDLSPFSKRNAKENL